MEKKNKSSYLDKASVVNRAGGKQMARGRFREALSCFQKALDLYGKCGQDKREYLAALMNNIGHAYVSLQKPDKALSFFSNAAELREDLGDTGGLAWQRANMGSALRDMESFESAIKEYRSALLLFESLGKTSGADDQHANLGYAYAMLGDTEQAARHYGLAADGYLRREEHERAELCRRNLAALRGRES